MKILVTGGTGFIGSKLCPSLLSKGHQLYVLTRNRLKAQKILPIAGIQFIEQLNEIPTDVHFDAVINLAGAAIVHRWTGAYKGVLKKSRIGITQGLMTFFSQHQYKPTIWINGSAIGYYGPQGDNGISETDTPNPSFSHELCLAWEQEALKAKGFGCRVCLLRTGIVLGSDGGVLAQMRTPFKAGLGGPIATGKQWMSWIHIDDLIRIIQFCLENASVEGPVNATAPKPVTNQEFTRILGKIWHRPTLLRMPAFVMLILYGQMAKELLISGQKVLPTKMLREKFVFTYPQLTLALEAIEGK
ncbi:MAG: TIGR01777 family oxidoreductase [Proteobacteria bacterium]|nr:TIGR01777 family oxidoreductase [Pseudomonadota bacterium]